jgi:hypothetical protein
MSRRLLVRMALGAACLAVALPAPARSQPPVRLVGMVQWISGTRLLVMTDSGVPVTVDLVETDQSSYRALRTGDRVPVDGAWAPDHRRVLPARSGATAGAVTAPGQSDKDRMDTRGTSDGRRGDDR